MLLSYLLPGIKVDAMSTALIVAVVIGFLNILVKPILVLLTLPITLLTLGLFLWIINAIIILIAAYFVSGFEVSSLWWAMLFSLLLALLQAVLHSIVKEEK